LIFFFKRVIMRCRKRQLTTHDGTEQPSSLFTGLHYVPVEIDNAPSDRYTEDSGLGTGTTTDDSRTVVSETTNAELQRLLLTEEPPDLLEPHGQQTEGQTQPFSVTGKPEGGFYRVYLQYAAYSKIIMWLRI
jgi:hypothetical protein